jgi:hypothetical protein
VATSDPPPQDCASKKKEGNKELNILDLRVKITILSIAIWKKLPSFCPIDSFCQQVIDTHIQLSTHFYRTQMLQPLLLSLHASTHQTRLSEVEDGRKEDKQKSTFCLLKTRKDLTKIESTHEYIQSEDLEQQVEQQQQT